MSYGCCFFFSFSLIDFPIRIEFNQPTKNIKNFPLQKTDSNNDIPTFNKIF